MAVVLVLSLVTQGDGEWRSAWGDRDIVFSQSCTSGVTVSGGTGAGARTGVDLTMWGTTNPDVGGSSFLAGSLVLDTSFGLAVTLSFFWSGGEVLFVVVGGA